MSDAVPTSAEAWRMAHPDTRVVECPNGLNVRIRRLTKLDVPPYCFPIFNMATYIYLSREVENEDPVSASRRADVVKKLESKLNTFTSNDRAQTDLLIAACVEPAVVDDSKGKAVPDGKIGLHHMPEFVQDYLAQRIIEFASAIAPEVEEEVATKAATFRDEQGDDEKPSGGVNANGNAGVGAARRDGQPVG